MYTIVYIPSTQQEPKMRTLILVGAMAAHAAAASVSFDYTGEVEFTWDYDARNVDDIIGIRVGDSVVGSFTIDLDTPGIPTPRNDSSFSYFDAVTDFQILVGDVAFLNNLDDIRLATITNDQTNTNADGLSIAVIMMTEDVNTAGLKATITDNTGEMFADTSLHNVVNLPFGNVPLGNIAISFIGGDNIRIIWQTLEMQQPVPEPSSIALLLGGLLICQYRNVLRRHGPDNRSA